MTVFTSPALAQEDSQGEVAPISAILLEIARREGTPLLFDEAMVRGLRARRPPSRLPITSALARVLQGTDIGFRVTSGGAYVLYRLSRGFADVPAVPEILVIGQRLQNVDIPRSEDGIQPYKLFSRTEVENAHRDNLDSFLRARLASNTDVLAPMQDVTNRPSETGSRIELRGAGTRRTLIMVDGRRLPGIANETLSLIQPDLNGIPTGAIERVEVLTGTAGGIYGPDAVGGVVNVILRRNYRGSELNVVTGISDRGDASHLRLEGRIGLSSDDDATQFMLFAAYSTSQRLTYGERDFGLRSRQLAFANAPDDYLFRQGQFRRLPVGNGITIYSGGSAPLVLDPELGGTDLGSNLTFLPLDFTGTDQQRAEVLQLNAGKVPFEYGPGPGGRDHSLLNDPTVYSGIFSGRHQFNGDGPELFVDGLYTRNRGEWSGTSDIEYGLIGGTAPGNPFTQLVHVRMPSPVLSSGRRTIEMLRIAGGLIVPLPQGWKAGADYVFGRSIYTIKNDGLIFDHPGSSYQLTLGRGTAGPAGQPPLRPIEDWQAYLEALPAHGRPSLFRLKAVNHFSDLSLRLAGPVADLPAGEMSLSLLAGQRREFVPRSNYRFNTLTPEPSDAVPHRKLKVTSAYGELLLPIVPQHSPLIPLRDLEIQFAGRYDRVGIEVPANSTLPNPTHEPLGPLFRTSRESFVFTVGGRVAPIPGVTLRASLATGTVAPALDQFRQTERTNVSIFAFDPKRGGRRVGSETPLTTLSGSPPDIGQEKGSTLSLGVIVTPLGKSGPRLSIDYSRIVIGDQIAPFPISAIALATTREDDFPERVTRLPLTDADRALGFTGGPISVIDIRAGNIGRTIIQAVDLQFDWPIAGVLGGEFRPYASVTWLPRVETSSLPELQKFDFVGYRDGPLEWRGNGGFNWTSGPTAIDLNLQFYDGYRIAAVLSSTSINALYERFQGSIRIPPQTYVDLAVSRVFHLESSFASSIRAQLAVQNLLDHGPPIIGYPDTPGYSGYGDPRRRRFELALSVVY